MKKHIPYFSFYKAPIRNIQPYKNITITDVHKFIIGTFLMKQTKKLRTISGKNENKEFKGSYFPYVTFSGTFKHRSNVALTEHSGLLAIDIDHLSNVAEVREKLLKDPFFATELLFVSPNGNGIKWIVSIQQHLTIFSHREMFQSIFTYLKETYAIEIDKACKDVSRATYLCYDPTAFIHPKYLINA